MAYVSKEVIQHVRTGMKAIRKKYGIKATVAGENSSTLKVTILSGTMDFTRVNSDGEFISLDYLQVNRYWIDEYWSSNPKAQECLSAINALCSEMHWDKSDIMTDYFNCAYYININIGRWNKPYIKE